jgi:hypothetical protein
MLCRGSDHAGGDCQRVLPRHPLPQESNTQYATRHDIEYRRFMSVRAPLSEGSQCGARSWRPRTWWPDRPGQGTFIQATLSQIALPELTALRRSLSGWLTAADGVGPDAAGSRRCSPPRCRISMSAVAGYAPAAARRAAKRRASHEHRRGKRYGGTAHRADRRTRGRAERVIKWALLRDDRVAAPPPRGPAVLTLPAHQWRVAAHGRRAPAHGDRVVHASPRGVIRPASPTRGRRQVPDA